MRAGCEIGIGNVISGLERLEGRRMMDADPALSGGWTLGIDDHADEGAWESAAWIDLNVAGDGSLAGVIGTGTDTDLLAFIPAASGQATITVMPSATLDVMVQVFSFNQQPWTPQEDFGFEGEAETLTFFVTEASPFFVVIDSFLDGFTGSYTVVVDAPGQTLPPPLPTVAPVVLGSASSSGRLTVTAFDPAGAGTAVFQQSGSGGATVAPDLSMATGSPELRERISTWTDPLDGLTYACARSDEGLILFMNRADGTWSWRNLSEELEEENISGITVFASLENVVTIAGLASSGDLILYQKIQVAGTTRWISVNISETQLRPAGQNTPDFVGDLVSYVTSWNGLNIAGLDHQGRVQSVWWAPGLSAWRTDDLSALTGAPPITGNLTPYVTSWGGINLAGTDATGKVNVTWWVPGRFWEVSNLTDLFAGPELTPGSVSSYVTPWGGLNVAGLGLSGEVIAYWWAPGLDQWFVTNLSGLVPGSTPPVERVMGVASPTGTINLIGGTADGGVARYFWNPGDGATWSYHDVDSGAMEVNATPTYAAAAGTWRVMLMESCLPTEFNQEFPEFRIILEPMGRLSVEADLNGLGFFTPIDAGTWAHMDERLEMYDGGESLGVSGVSGATTTFTTTGAGDGVLLPTDTEELLGMLSPEEQAFIIDHCGSLQGFVDSLVLRWDRIG